MKRKGNQKGFTLVELIVVIAAVAILLAATVIGIVEYSRYARFKRENEYAQTLFNAAQTQLTQYSQLGGLDPLVSASSGSLVPLSSLVYEEGGVTAEQIWGIDDPTYQGEIRYLMIEAGDYTLYRTGALGDDRKTALFNLFDAYVYDKSILNAAICVEFDAEEGLVYSVLYSDRVESFTYEGTAGTAVSIADRTASVRKKSMVGYYGVDELSKATSAKAEKPVISSVTLNNKETLNLSFRLSKVTEALEKLSYELVIYDTATRSPLLSVVFNNDTVNGSAEKTKLVAKSTARTTCTIRALVTPYSGAVADKTEYVFPAWIESDGTVRLVLDAVHLGASTEAYLALDQGELDETFSLHRFGISADNIYCTIQGSGGNYKTTARKESNSEQPYFGSYSAASGGNRTYTLFNARHLNNIRFVVCDPAEPSTTFTLTSDISWQALIDAQAVYLDLDRGGVHPVTNGDLLADAFTPEEEKAFVSIEELREGDILQSTGKGYRIKDISIFDESNAYYGVEIDSRTEATGFFLRNGGTIQNILFDNIAVQGTDHVGAVCGINAGELTNLSVLNTDGVSAVSGSSYIGGITGSQDVTDGDVSYSGLLNRARVTGVSYVGGIVGGLTADRGVQIAMTGCSNYGKIVGIADPAGRDDTEYLGGITGYAAQKRGGTLTISGCTSSPEYEDSEIFSGNTLKVQLNGSYVGGIVGFNDAAVISDCNTLSERGKSGYVMGDKFVGGIVGYNNGSLDGNGSHNQAAVIANRYAGGIVGVNAQLGGNGEPVVKNNGGGNTDLVVSRWINDGVVVAMYEYAGGIAGLNTGRILNCGSDVEYNTRAQRLFALGNCDYAGGMVGYNNGEVSANSVTSLVTVVRGKDFVGGVVGYNAASAEVSNYALQGSYVAGRNFVGGFAGLNLSKNLMDISRPITCNPNSVTGSFFVGGVIGGNIVNSNEDLYSAYTTYNILGSVSGKEFVGGFIGYNQLTLNENKSETAIEAILAGVSDDYQKNVELLQQISEHDNISAVFVVDGTESTLRGVSGDLYVGGVIGYCNQSSYLHIKNVVNRTPITANRAVAASVQGGGNGALYSYAGGIIGLVGENVVVENCKNEGLGGVTSQGTYTGGIAEINQGLIARCTASSGGTDSTDYIGGIVGLNAPQSDKTVFGNTRYTRDAFSGQAYLADQRSVYLGVYNCAFSGILTGRSCVGGIAAVNAGLISDPVLDGTLTGYGENVGGAVGVNAAGGVVLLRQTANISISGSGQSVGGLIGKNSGRLELAAGETAAELTVNTGCSVSGAMYVGGIIGTQSGGQDSLSGLVNGASVTAANGYAGGIVGRVEAAGQFMVEKCENRGAVQATLAGYAGGIVAFAAENCTVSSCVNNGSVTASNGVAGGIAGDNRGIVSACAVFPYAKQGSVSSSVTQWLTGQVGSRTSRLDIAAKQIAGGITGNNLGTIRGCAVISTNLSNLATSGEKCSAGGIAGVNEGRIELSGNAVKSVTVSAVTNGSNAGGIAGQNAASGVILATSGYAQVGDTADLTSLRVQFGTSAVTFGNLGGVTGENAGSIQKCRVFAQIVGARGDSATPGNGYGGVSGVNSGAISDCSFDGSVYGNGTVSAISPVGGIVGKNLKTGVVKLCIVGYGTGSTQITCGTANTAYGYLGGVAGWNLGQVIGTDNHSKSSAASVSIVGYAGHVGGIVGFNDESGLVTAYEVQGQTPVRVSTGANWLVHSKYYSNDCGTGGILGYSSSGSDLRYVDNYATVWNSSDQISNTAVGGMIGRLENKVRYNFRMSYCSNYGEVWSSALSGGMIGRWKYLGGTMEYCSNYADIGKRPSTMSSRKNCQVSSGLIASFYQVNSGSHILINACSNYGNIYSDSSSSGVSGVNDVESFILTVTDCVNTGSIIAIGTGGSHAGISVISSKFTARFYRCRNYGNASSQIVKSNFSGISYGSTPSVVSHCFDYSNASSTAPISRSKPKTNRNNYYVYLDGGDIPTISDYISLAEATYQGANGGMAKDATTPFANSYDGLAGTRCSLYYNTKENISIAKGNSVTVSYTLTQITEMAGFGIKWCNNGTVSADGSGTSRQYLYELFYVNAQTGATTKVTSADSYGGRNTYNDAYGMYVETGYSKGGDESMYYHAFVDGAGQTVPVSQIILVVHQVNSYAGGDIKANVGDGVVWTKSNIGETNSPYICIYDIFGIKAGTTFAEFSANPYGCAITPPKQTGGSASLPGVGVPLVPGSDSGGYYLRDGLRIFETMTGLAISPAARGNGVQQGGAAASNLFYTEDFSPYANRGSSIRYQIIDELEPKLFEFYKQMYSIKPEIGAMGITDIGGAYAAAWSSSVEAYQFEVRYTVGSVSSGTYITNDPYFAVDMSDSWSGDITFYVRPVFWQADGNGGYTKQYGDWVSSVTAVKKALPVPQVHLELVGTQNSSYVAVLDNYEAYVDSTGAALNATISYKISNLGTFTFTVAQRRSGSITLTAADSAPLVTSQALSTSLTAEQKLLYTQSLPSAAQTHLSSVSSLKGTDYCWTEFQGFYGSSADSLYYMLRLNKANSNVETSYYSEMLAFDKTLNDYVALSWGESHVTGQGQAMTATLAGLGSQLTATDGDIIVRTYPWSTQGYQCYYGHEVADSVQASQLAQLTDNGVQVYTAAQGFANGYVAQLNQDGTYRILYSAILANPSAADYAVQIDMQRYTVNTAAGTVTAGQKTYPIQPVPVISADYDYSADRDEYRFYWDQGLGYANAEYKLTLIGLSADRTSQVQLAWQTTTAANYDAATGSWSAAFTDNNWNYPNLELKVERLGTVDAGGALASFPSQSQREFNLKIRLARLSTPSVTFYVDESGIVEKDSLIYQVDWAGLSGTSQLSELSEYEICVNYGGGELTFRTGDSQSSVEEAIDSFEPYLFAQSPTATSAVINLNSLAGLGSTAVEISVRAIAIEDAVTYKNSLDGVPVSLQLSARMETPNLANLTYQHTGIVSTGAFSSMGVTLSMSQAYAQSGKYEMTLEIVDLVNGQYVHLADIYNGAAPADKNHPISMTGGLAMSTYTLTGLSADYAGKYLKVALRAVSDSEISSVWTFQDSRVQQYAYFRLPSVQAETPVLSESRRQIIYTHGSPDEPDWDRVDQVALFFNTVDYAGRYVIDLVQDLRLVNINDSQDHRASKTVTVEIVKTAGGYDAYYSQTDDAGYVTASRIGAVTDQGLELPYYVISGLDALEMHAWLYAEGDMITLVLPDSDAEGFYSTKIASLQAIAQDQAHYADSGVFTWYRTTLGGTSVTMTNGYDAPAPAPAVTAESFTAAVSAREDGTAFELYSSGSYRRVIEITCGGMTRVYGMPGVQVGGTVESVLLLDSATWGGLGGQDALIRVRDIIDGRGLSQWSSYVTVVLPLS